MMRKNCSWLTICCCLLTCIITSGKSLPAASDANWKLLWDDEFNGPEKSPVDAMQWTAAVGGGGWPGNPDATTVFPQTMLVDYVRVYQHATASAKPSN
jgi:hypothetical protein